MKKLLISSVCLAVLAACNSGTEEQKANQEAAKQEVTEQTSTTTTQAEQELVSGIDKQHFDHSVRPQDDLFLHVNGKWLNEFEIPADKSNYGAFTMLAEQAREDVQSIIEDAANSNAEKGSDAQKVGDLYQSYMDEELLDELGTKPLQPELDKIAAIKDLSDLSEYIAYAQMVREAPFSTYVYIDARQPATYITKLSPNGVGLPARDL